jgi:hypothetical protein
MNGYAPSAHATRVLAHLRKGTRYDAQTGDCTFDGFIRETDLVEREAARLVDLARRSYRKMAEACKKNANPLFPTAKLQRSVMVELAVHFGLIPQRAPDVFGNRNDASERALAHELINPWLYYGKAATAVKQGCIRTRSGQELSVGQAVALFESYLGVERRKAEIAIHVKGLNDGRRERRMKRRQQALAEVIMSFYPLFRHLRKDAGQAFAEEVLDEIWSRETTQRAIGRYVSNRKGRGDINHFIAEISYARMQERSDRGRALAAARKRRSRLKLK